MLAQLQAVRDEILRRADIIAHAERAGFRRKKRAWFCGFHKNERTCAASIKNGRVHCFVCNRSWNVFDLEIERTGLDFMGALRALASEYCVPFEEKPLTQAQRRTYARRRAAAEREARPLARLAWWWLQGRMAELDDAKAAAITESGIDVDTLAEAARELCRLQRLGPDHVLAEYLRYKAEHPDECGGLIQAGWLWENACRAAVRAIIDKIEREDRKVVANAA